MYATAFERNHFYPFVINLRKYTLEITVIYEAPPIGGIIGSKPEENIDGSYSLEITEGSTFSLKAKLTKENEDVNGCTWSVEDMDNQIPISLLEQHLTEGAFLTGSIPAQPTDRETKFTLKVKEEDGKEHGFGLTIAVKAIGTKTNSATIGSYPIIALPQVVGMY